MAGSDDVFLRKAEESLAGAASELANRRYNNCANRCYYACFQAAIAALIRHGIQPGGDGQWSHSAVQAQFAGQLVNRRKRFSGDLGDTLSRNMTLRQAADYRQEAVSEIQAARALRRAESFVAAVRIAGGSSR
jgi:uncharacterized protein (UPF0332 family)